MIPLAIAHEPHPLMILPFALMLLAIACMPFIHKHWWEHHYPKVSVGLGLITVLYYIFALEAQVHVLHVGIEYISFISLIGSLFVVAGGIHINVKGEATPGINCLYLLIGAVLSNLIGTTGASMLLIRPWIRMNKYRITAFHVVFFIFIVSNVSGSLTPIGDPPLFLGYLRGVPFFWTLTHLWPAWLVGVSLLIGIFHVFDRRNFLRAPKGVREKETAHEEWRFEGLGNLVWLAVILGAVFLPLGYREILMVSAAAASYFPTNKQVHEMNHFSFAPIIEVAWLFVGIFATMTAALDYLSLHSRDFGLSSPQSYYWITGGLSGVLDNAPTYLTFLAASMGFHGLSVDNPADVQTYLTAHPVHLTAISLGAVCFGAMTYIGNGPNFMVKAIADNAKINTPGFFAYIFLYSVPILLPVFALLAYIFIR